MGRLFGFALIAIAMWVGMTIYTDGIEGLSGRVESVASISGPSAGDTKAGNAAGERRSIPQRFGDVVDSEMQKRSRMMSERLDDL
jgi:hypothetical protein